MTVLCAPGIAAAQFADYVIVGSQYDGKALSLANPATTCLRRMRPWKAVGEEQYGYCLLDKDHRGRCSTVVFHCDGCGKARRGQPAYSDDSVSACWMCMNESRQRRGA